MPPSPEALHKLEKKLLQQQKELESATLAAVTEGRSVTATDSLDPVDQAVLSYQKEMLFTQGTQGAAQLSLVRRALHRIQDGTYGDCTYCGQSIGLKRLEALPWTPLCIECQERLENGELENPERAA